MTIEITSKPQFYPIRIRNLNMQLKQGDKVKYIGEDLFYSEGLHLYNLRKDKVYTISAPMDGIDNCVCIDDERHHNVVYPVHLFVKVEDEIGNWNEVTK